METPISVVSYLHLLHIRKIPDLLEKFGEKQCNAHLFIGYIIVV